MCSVSLVLCVNSFSNSALVSFIFPIFYMESRSLAYSPIHSLTPLPPSHSLTHTHPLSHSLPHTLTHTLTPPLTHSLTHSLPHSFPHSLPHSLTHSLTHSSLPNSVCGTTGEGLSMSIEERQQVTEEWIKASRKRFCHFHYKVSNFSLS